jgi:hypothetical protein
VLPCPLEKKIPVVARELTLSSALRHGHLKLGFMVEEGHGYSPFLPLSLTVAIDFSLASKLRTYRLVEWMLLSRIFF